MVPEQEPQDKSEKIAEALSSWANTSIKNAEDGLVSALVRGALKSSKPINAFVTWLLALAGASIVLLLTKISSIDEILSNNGLLWAFWVLLFSGITGIIAKFRGEIVQALLLMEEGLIETCTSIIENHQKNMNEINDLSGKEFIKNIDTKKIIDEIIGMLPKIMKKWAEKRYEKSCEDSLAFQRIAMKQFVSQLIFLTLQIFSLLASVILIFIGLKKI